MRGAQSMARLAKLPPIHADLHACTMCGACVPVCPAYQEAGWESASPRGRVFALRQYDMRGPLDRILRRQVVPGEAFARAAWECTGCGACEEVCPADIPFDSFWDDVKGWMVNSGFARKELEPYLVNVQETRNLYGEPHEDRAKWMPAEAVQSSRPEVVYWVGCVASYRKQQIAKAVVKILNAAKVPYRILGAEEWCSGAPLARMGYEDYVRKQLMRHNIEAVAETGAKALVTACAECYRAFRKDYRTWGGNPPFSVFHLSEYIERLVREKRLTFTKPLPEKFAFHDACNMGRVCGAFEPPRRAIKYLKDVKLLEMFPAREDALCSGGGGGFPDVYAGQAAGVASRRLQAAADTGAGALVTACPHAEVHLERIARDRNMAVRILDLAEVVVQGL